MSCREVTIETRLQQKNPVVDYANEFVSEYSKYKRMIWQELTDKDHDKRFKSIAEYKKYLRNTYNLLGRTVNSLVLEVQGSMNAYMELKQTELNDLNIKIAKKRRKIKKLKEDINSLMADVAKNVCMDVNLLKYHYKKQSLYYQKNKLNKMIQRRTKLRYQIDNNIYDICFGTKKEFSKQYRLSENGYKSHKGWHNHFIKCRDKNILYVGSSNESYGNLMFQMTYNKESDDFTIKIRKEDKYCGDSEKYAVCEHIDFKYRKDELKNIIKAYDRKMDISTPLTYRLHREGNKWYLQVMFSVSYDGDKNYYAAQTAWLAWRIAAFLVHFFK